MKDKGFYLDTCIWLNLLKRECQLVSGKPVWIVARELIEQIVFVEEKKIFYSGLILKEIANKMKEEISLTKLKRYFSDIKAIPVATTEEDYLLARRIEKQSGFCIGFYDCLHIAICRRLELALVTRDKALIEFANGQIEVKRPEELL